MHWGKCSQCGKPVAAFIRPAIKSLGIEEKTYLPSECGECLAKHSVESDPGPGAIRGETGRAVVMPKRFERRTFDNFVVGSDNERAYRAALDYEPSGGGLYFVGPTGTGKTHLAASIAHKHSGKLDIMFISLSRFLKQLRDQFSLGRGDNRTDYLGMAQKARLLIVDDLGVENPTAWVKETLFELINYRYDHELSTIITTNLKLREVEEKLGRRITSRLTEMCRPVICRGEDFRMKGSA